MTLLVAVLAPAVMVEEESNVTGVDTGLATGLWQSLPLTRQGDCYSRLGLIQMRDGL